MTTTPSPDAPPSTSMTDAEYGALRASAALWAGTSVLITDQYGRVLVQHVDYRDTCLLPGGGLDQGESPASGAARELGEELGITAVLDRCLAVDWVSAATSGAPAVMRFPGEIIHVFDGGTWNDAMIDSIRLPPSEVTAIDLVEPAQLPDMLSATDARRAMSAVRARINAAGAVLLENGRPIAPTVLDRAGVLQTARPANHYPWHHGPAPQGLTIIQVLAWQFAPDGRVLVLIDPRTGTAVLPGGTPEQEDHGDPLTTLRRESAEEAAARFESPLLLGHVTDPAQQQRAYLRYATRLTHVGPAHPDPATGHTYTRILTSPEQALELFDWGAPAAEQLAAAHRARERLGIPRAARQPATELRGSTTW
ncbi:NUDIX domain-containing protein [Streptomyces sp. NPDC059783]|uniref:NUDIX hydrolase n=1 Tax=Streptomyces sp. NPDC059783 TaxID=3346944 RepID=UPI00366954BF